VNERFEGRKPKTVSAFFVIARTGSNPVSTPWMNTLQ
jgi:hypothetical protein